jgi:hypothetical protein
LIEFREGIVAVIGQQFSFADHHHTESVNRVHEIARIFASPAAKLVDWRRLADLQLCPAIEDLLGSDNINDVELAMLCLRTIFDNLEPDRATELFGALGESPIIDAVMHQFESPNNSLCIGETILDDIR